MFHNTHTHTHIHIHIHIHTYTNAAGVSPVLVQCLQQYVGLAVMEGGGASVTCPDMACHKTGVLLDSEVRVCFKKQASVKELLPCKSTAVISQ